METEIRDLVYNLLCDLKKKEINKFSRAKLIRAYLNDTNLSIRNLAKRMCISKSTIEDWLRWENIKEEEYEEYIEQGYTPTDIAYSLRDGTLSRKNVETDKALLACIRKLEIFKIKPPYSNQTRNLITQLRRILNVIEEQTK